MSQIDPQINVSGRQHMLFDANSVAVPACGMFEPEYWRSRDAIEGSALGRGTTHFVRAGEKNWVLRHYRRGGLVARFLKDRYLGFRPECSRSFREWQLLVQLHRKGLPVPRPIAASVTLGGLFYTADIITEKIDGSCTLADLLKSSVLLEKGWEEVGQTIRRLHDADCYHADLNAMNVLLVGERQVYLIDFDRARFKPAGSWKTSNLDRLHRSLMKLKRNHPDFHFSSFCWQSLLSGYCRS